MKLGKLLSRLAVLDTRRLPVLETKAGTTPRTRGDAWMKTRRQVLLAGEFRCVDCGHISADNEIDHDTPLEQGGAALDKENLKIRCVPCHKIKSALEARRRSGRSY